MLMKLLVLLAEQAGQVVSKDRILDAVWEARFVSESSLTRSVAELRQILGDSRRNPQCIETIPKRGYRFIAPVQPGPRTAGPRLAVLLFDNLNKNPELEYFAEGISDALITELGSIGSLRVISRQSVLQFKNTNRSLPEIARELRVDAIVEGSALHVGKRVRITAQLVQAEPERHLWARDYDCEIGDVLSIQARVARAVAESIQATLTPQNLSRLSRQIHGRPDSHLAYLKARFHAMKWSLDDIQTGLQYLGEVIEKDPGFAPAHELLAGCLLTLGFWGYMPPRVAYPQAKESALKALELDEFLSEGHATLGMAKWLLDWDLAACERELLRALELNPSCGIARGSHALFLVTIPRDRRRAIEQASMELDLDPLSADTNFGFAKILFLAGEHEQAIDQILKTLKMHPESSLAYSILGWAYLGRSKTAEAIAAFEKATDLSRDAVALGYLGHAYGLAGRRDAALAVLQELLERSTREDMPQTSLAYLYMGLGDFDRAFESLEKCYEERDSRLFWFPLTVFSRTFRADPRFERLERRLKAPAG
jgi:TolB-like protein